MLHVHLSAQEPGDVLHVGAPHPVHVGPVLVPQHQQQLHENLDLNVLSQTATVFY